MTSGKKRTIGQSNIKPEQISTVKERQLKPVEYQPIKFPWRIRVKVKIKQRLGYISRIVKLVRKHPKATFTIIRVYMKIKGDQTSTKVGISFLITVLALFGINVDPEFFSSNVQSLIEGGVLVVGAVTSLYAIFKDEEKAKNKSEEK